MPRKREQLVEASPSQLGADIWAFEKLGRKIGGYFVEVGSHDAFHLSNTFWLEKFMGWRGVVVEPSPEAGSQFRKYRRSAFFEGAAVSRSAANSEADLRLVFDRPELSRLESIEPKDIHESEGNRDHFTLVQVKTETLEYILRTKVAPVVIDFLSIDTEGSEIEVLDGVDFQNRVYRTVALENAGDRDKEAKYDQIFLGAGYEKEEKILSRWDSWYFLPKTYG